MSIGALPSRYWEQKAEEARAKARTMVSAEARELIRDVARRYRLMAVIASKRGPRRDTRAVPFAAELSGS
jgi:hypothetical protein